MESAAMLSVQEIVRIALAEHEVRGHEAQVTERELHSRVASAIANPSEVPAFSRSSLPLSVVRFRCMLQDTGYPLEVYLPPVEGAPAAGSDAPMDWSRLKERWVGWGIEIPGEQPWVTSGASSISEELSALNLSSNGQLPTVTAAAVRDKFPSPDSRDDYTGALIKVYADTSFKPASLHSFLGIVSSSPLPSPISPGETFGSGDDSQNGGVVSVPALHVLQAPEEAYCTLSIPSVETADAYAPLPVDPSRDSLIDYLASTFTPADKLAAEVLLLQLISRPTSRPTSLPPIGTLSVNYILAPGSGTRFHETLSHVQPLLQTLPLSLPLLHNTSFSPSAVHTPAQDLAAGVLQLPAGTLLVVEEDKMGTGGQLNEKALGNLRTLSEVVRDQELRYEYPFMDGLKMPVEIVVAVVSEGKSLLPVDVHLPLEMSSVSNESRPTPSGSELDTWRTYLQSTRAGALASQPSIPDAAADAIQESFVAARRAGDESAQGGEEGLKRRMRIARLMALTYPSKTLTCAIWEKTVALDNEIQSRIVAREQRAKLPNGHHP